MPLTASATGSRLNNCYTRDVAYCITNSSLGIRAKEAILCLKHPDNVPNTEKCAINP